MDINAIDIYDYDGTLCDSQEFVNRLSYELLLHIIEDNHQQHLSDSYKEHLEYLAIAEYAGFFWKKKAPAILDQFDVDFDCIDPDFAEILNRVRKHVRNNFYGKDTSAYPLSEAEQTLADQIQARLDAFFIANYGRPAQYGPFNDVARALENPNTLKAIATQRGHQAISRDLQRFPEIGHHIRDRYTGIGYNDEINGPIVKPKPDPDLILSQYRRLLEEARNHGTDLSSSPVRMTGDSILDVIAMRKAMKIINEDRFPHDYVNCCVIGVVRQGPYAKDIADQLTHAAKDPHDHTGDSDITIYIVENFEQHRELTDQIDNAILCGLQGSASYEV